jgi:hypothetical protein
MVIKQINCADEVVSLQRISEEEMAAVTCASCGTSVDEFDTYFGESGQVCGACHSSTEASDSARFREAAEAPMGGLPDGTFEKSTTTVKEDGSVVTRTVSVSAGPLGMLIQLIMGLIRKLTGGR